MKRRGVIVRCGWGAAVGVCGIALLVIACGEEPASELPPALPPASAQTPPRLPAYPGSLAGSPEFLNSLENRPPVPTALPASLTASEGYHSIAPAPPTPPGTILPAGGIAPALPAAPVAAVGPVAPAVPNGNTAPTAAAIPRPVIETPSPVIPAGPLVPPTPVIPAAAPVLGAPTAPIVPVPTLASVPTGPVSPAAYPPPAGTTTPPIVVPVAASPEREPVAPTIAKPPEKVILPPSVPAKTAPVHPSKTAIFPQPDAGVPPATPAVLPTPSALQRPAADPPATLGSVVNPPLQAGTQAQNVPQPQWYQVGSDPNLRAYWDNGLIFETANKDWRIHVGGRFQAESVWWSQSQRMRGNPPGNGGIPASGPGDGVGHLDDGMFFRRVRLRSDGVGYETIEYALEVDFEQLNYITYDHLWFGMKDLPILGTVRIGQQKVPMGMDNIGSDYHLTFLERDVLSEGIWGSLFAPGILVANTYLNDHVTFQTMFHKVQPIVQFFTGAFGDGDYASTTRLTGTPIYENEGANVLHIGTSYQWRHANLGRTIQPGGTGNDFADTQHVTRFRARPELRDAIGIGSIGSGLLGGDTARFVDTGFFLADNIHTVSPELLVIAGRFSVQAEAAWAFVENARSIYPSAAFNTPRGNPTFWGGYIETSYFLTGEHRGYDRRFGTFDRPRVRENAFLVRGEDGRFHMGTGAWQVGYRYSYLDLNDNGINGGQLGQHTAVLNWYLNDNTKIQFQYSNIQRNVINPAVSGTVHGFGMLAQWYF